MGVSGGMIGRGSHERYDGDHRWPRCKRIENHEQLQQWKYLGLYWFTNIRMWIWNLNSTLVKQTNTVVIIFTTGLPNFWPLACKACYTLLPTDSQCAVTYRQDFIYRTLTHVQYADIQADTRVAAPRHVLFTRSDPCHESCKLQSYSPVTWRWSRKDNISLSGPFYVPPSQVYLQELDPSSLHEKCFSFFWIVNAEITELLWLNVLLVVNDSFVLYCIVVLAGCI